MRERIETIIKELAAKHADRRKHVFSVSVHSLGEQKIALAGRVLEAENLTAIYGAIEEALPNVEIDVTGVEVLRKGSATIRTVATNITDLHVEPSFLTEMMTQIFNGWRFEVLEERDKWCYVRQEDGYLGWAYKNYFADDANAGAFTHIISAPIAHVYSEQSDAGNSITRFLAGTKVRAEAGKGEWVRVMPAGAMLPGGWVKAADVRSLEKLPLAPADARRQIVADARKLIGVYYLWGGGSAMGIDCSGLAQICHRLAGYEIPRDADMQYQAAQPVEPPYQAGDLFFFGGEGMRKVTHVGICTGDGGVKMIHSSRTRNGVYEEDIAESDNLRTTFMGARSYLPR